MTTTEKEMDMLNGGIAGKLILFSLPLVYCTEKLELCRFRTGP